MTKKTIFLFMILLTLLTACAPVPSSQIAEVTNTGFIIFYIIIHIGFTSVGFAMLYDEDCGFENAPKVGLIIALLGPVSLFVYTVFKAIERIVKE